MEKIGKIEIDFSGEGIEKVEVKKTPISTEEIKKLVERKLEEVLKLFKEGRYDEIIDEYIVASHGGDDTGSDDYYISFMSEYGKNIDYNIFEIIDMIKKREKKGFYSYKERDD